MLLGSLSVCKADPGAVSGPVLFRYDGELLIFPIGQFIRSHTALRNSFSHTSRRSRSRGSHKIIDKSELRSTPKIVVLSVIARSSILNAILSRSGFLCSVIPINRDIFVAAVKLVHSLLYYNILRLTCSHKSSK